MILVGNTSSVFSTGLMFQPLHSTHLPSQQICGYLSFRLFLLNASSACNKACFSADLILVEKADLTYITET